MFSYSLENISIGNFADLSLNTMAMPAKRDRLGRINSNWARKQNIARADGELAQGVVQSIDPMSDARGSALVAAILSLQVDKSLTAFQNLQRGLRLIGLIMIILYLSGAEAQGACHAVLKVG